VGGDERRRSVPPLDGTRLAWAAAAQGGGRSRWPRKPHCAGALRVGRRLPGGAAGLGTEGTRGGEGQPPAQPHAVEATADSAIEVTG